MDIFAYFRFYRRLSGGEWAYIYDQRLDLYHWVPTWWLKRNRWDYEYDILEYECW